MTIANQERVASGIRIRGLSHFTLPVHDRYAAARFYTAVFNAEIDHESDPDRVKQGKSRALQVGINLAPGIQLDLFEQDFGQPTLHQSHPHHAFDVKAEDVQAWVEQLSYWGVPFVGPITRSGTTGCELYFRDVDGNNLELHCADYPEELRAGLPVGPYDKQQTENLNWPPAHRVDEANQQLEEKLAQMRSRKGSRLV